MTESEKIAELRKFLHEQNHNYYVLNSPVISDQEFDQKMKVLTELEARHPELEDPNSPSQRVGSDINIAFSQVHHERPMLSLGNTYSRGEVADFYSRVLKESGRSQLDISCELKFDGTSISLIYEDGKLKRAATRGDGVVGDDVTRNVRTIRNVPLQLRGDYPKHLEMRGEILMPRASFDALNQQRIDIGDTPFANPRNAASGSLKLQSSKQVAERHLTCMLYYVLTDDIQFPSHTSGLEAAKKWGFEISPNYRLCHNLEEIYEYIDEWDIKRHDLPYDTDGIVLKINDLSVQRNLGLTAKSPRWAVAYKFKAEQAHSRLREVTYQVGRTGIVTPVANMDPVQLAGTTVRRASLHNVDIIRGLDLHVGDMVVIEKGGEIIPKIVGVDIDERLDGAEPVAFPTNCPVCGSTLVREIGEAGYYCPNDSSCPPQIIGKLIHYVSRGAMDIDSLGSEKIEQLYNAGLISKVSDFYRLTAADLEPLPGYKERGIQKVLDGVSESKDKPYDRVLFALGIRYVGSTVAKSLAVAFPSIDELMNASISQLIATDDIGEKIATSVYNFFQDDDNKRLVSELQDAGLQMRAQAVTLASDSLTGLQFVVSGVFENIGREELKALIASNGGKVMNSISAKTSFVVAGENMGPAKREKAEKLGVKIIGYDDLIKMIQ